MLILIYLIDRIEFPCEIAVRESFYREMYNCPFWGFCALMAHRFGTYHHRLVFLVSKDRKHFQALRYVRFMVYAIIMADVIGVRSKK